MEMHDAASMVWTPAPAEWFTGSVRFGEMAPPPAPDDLNVLGVHFEPGARTDWHRHPGRQVLYVVAGAGFVQTEAGETVAIGPGDVVVTPPGEVHWHGATDDSFMVHLSITVDGATEWLGSKVTDEEYRRR